MTKIVKIAVITLFIILALFFFAPYLLNKAVIKSQIEQQISQKYGVIFESRGNISIRFLPYPKIALNDVIVVNSSDNDKYFSTIQASRLIIRPNFFSVFGGKPKIKGLIFENPVIKSGAIDDDIYKKSSILQEDALTLKANVGNKSNNRIFNFQNSEKEVFNFKNIEFIEFKNGSFVKNNIKGKSVIDLKEVNFLLKNQPKKQKLFIEGYFLSFSLPTAFSLVINANNNKESSLKIQSSIFDLVFSGKFTDSSVDNLLKSNFSGKFHANIFNPKIFLTKYSPKNNLLALKIKATQPLEINADISNDNGNIKASKIMIKSQLLDGIGNIVMDFNLKKPQMIVDFNFNNIDINSIWFFGFLNSDDDIIRDESQIVKNFIANNRNYSMYDGNKSIVLESTIKEALYSDNAILDNLDLTAKIKVKLARYRDGNLRDTNISFSTTNDGNLILESLTSTIEGGLIKAEGLLENDNNILKFIGKIEISATNLSKSLSWLGLNPGNFKPQILSQYNFKANLLTLPNFISFNQINLIVNSADVITGNFLLDDSSVQSVRDVNLSIDYLNYDDYITGDIKNSYLFGGSLLNKVLWLKTTDPNYNINFLFDRLTYKNNNFYNQSLKIIFGQGYLGISDINLSSTNINIKGSINIDIRGADPSLKLVITSNNLQLDSTKNDFGEKFFNLTSLKDFSGKIDINIDNFKLDDLEIKDIKVDGELRNGFVDFKNFDFKIYGGVAKYKGLITFKPTKTINGSLELVGIDNKKFLSNIYDINNVFGASNISAVINSSANNMSEFFTNLNGVAQFISGDVLVVGFGIYDLAVKMAKPQIYLSQLANPNSILFANNSQSSFKSVGGAIEFQKGKKNTKFNIKTSDAGINGVIYGSINEDKIFDASANFIFISGNLQNPIPLNIATNFKGKSGYFEQNTNYSQIEQYLGQQLSINY
jgi:uncharacterized protein involved in outer membrane biogenesis